MNRLLSLLTLFLPAALPVVALDMTEVTAQYIANASFENDVLSSLTPVNNSADGLRGYTVGSPQGWNVQNGANAVSLIVNADCYTDNNFGRVTTLADGSQAYYLRMGWSTGTTTLSQTLKALPSGSYKLVADVRSAYANQATSSLEMKVGALASTMPFSPGSSNCFTSMKWSKQELVFSHANDGDATIFFVVNWLSGGSCVMIDNVRLFRLSDDYVVPQEPTEIDVESPTEGVITNDFVSESIMKADLMQMLARFATYMKNDFQLCVAPNSVGEECGCFKGENTMGNDERGVRPNADLSMICAFLVKYGKGKATLPEGVTWDDLETIAMKSLVFAYSTHKANRLKVTAGNKYWGSTSTDDFVWESSLWAMSVAYAAFFQWDKLSEQQRGYVYNLLKAECNYELNRSIPTRYNGDTKAEENGWEADVLAVTLGLFPNDELAPRWFQRLREFAINSYSHKDDATDNTVIDPSYDQKTVKDLYRGKNLYDDYTLQNHNYFHTSYQNVVIQELGEAALALKLFQRGLHGEERWHTNALMHNCQAVMDNVLYDLALADGELAMPNGNDWSLFLYDQITSYSTNACFLRDPHALLLENLAYQQIKARQTTTNDGSWLLRPDVGARRMGVEAHRVMMSWLMHEMLSTADLAPTTWPDFLGRYSRARVFTSQNIVRAANDQRFTCFSWSQGLKSYTGYIAANSVDKNKIIVPFRANNTGNFLGWYDVQDKATNAVPVVSGKYQLDGNAWVMNGELQTNDGMLNNRFAIYSTPGNPVVYLDYVRANDACTITAEKGGLMAVSVDELTKTSRTLYYSAGSNGDVAHRQLDGSTLTTLPGPWINVDNAVSIINTSGKSFSFGEKTNNNSVMTARLYGSYSNQRRQVAKGDVVDCRALTYYSNMTAEQTDRLFDSLTQLSSKVPKGWNGIIVPEGNGEKGTEGPYYMLLSNFAGTSSECTIASLTNPNGSPVFSVNTTIDSQGATATFSAGENSSVVNMLRFFIQGIGIEAIQEEGNPYTIYLLNQIKGNNKLTVNAFADDGKTLSETITLSTKVLKVTIDGGTLLVEEAASFPGHKATVINATLPDATHSQPSAAYDLGGRKLADGNLQVSGLPNGSANTPIYIQNGRKIALQSNR